MNAESTVEVRGTSATDYVYLRRAAQWALAVWTDLAKKQAAADPNTPAWLPGGRPEGRWSDADETRLTKKLALAESDPIVVQLLPVAREQAANLTHNPVGDRYRAARALHDEQDRIDPDPANASISTGASDDDTCRHGVRFTETCTDCDEDF